MCTNVFDLDTSKYGKQKFLQHLPVPVIGT